MREEEAQRASFLQNAIMAYVQGSPLGTHSSRKWEHVLMDPNTFYQGKSEQLRYNSFLNGTVLTEWGDTKAWKQTNTLAVQKSSSWWCKGEEETTVRACRSESMMWSPLPCPAPARWYRGLLGEFVCSPAGSCCSICLGARTVHRETWEKVAGVFTVPCGLEQFALLMGSWNCWKYQILPTCAFLHSVYRQKQSLMGPCLACLPSLTWLWLYWWAADTLPEWTETAVLRGLGCSAVHVLLWQWWKGEWVMFCQPLCCTTVSCSP